MIDLVVRGAIEAMLVVLAVGVLVGVAFGSVVTWVLLT